MHLMSAQVKLASNLKRANFGIFHHSFTQTVDKAPVLEAVPRRKEHLIIIYF